MNSNLKPLITMALTGWLAAACTKGVPDISQLRSLDGFLLDQTSASISSKSSPVFSVTGKCDSKFEDVEISLDGGDSWKQISSLANSHTVNCRVDGSFQASFDFSGIPLEISRWSGAGSNDSLYFRGVSELGYSFSQKLTLNTKKPGSAFHLSGGGSHRTSLSHGYKLVDRVHSGQSLNEVSPEGYKLKAVVW